MDENDNPILKSLASQLKGKDTKNIFNNLIYSLGRRNDNAQGRIVAYQQSLRDYLKLFREEVLTDFSFNRKHDRRVKRCLVIFMFAFFVLLFFGVLVTVLAYIFGWGITSNLTELFKLSFLGIVLAGAVSLITIIFKYIFNKSDDVFYRYSVDLYKHIKDERCSPPDNEKNI